MQYAIRTLIVLALQGDDLLPVREIAEDYHVPRKYLEMIMVDLRRAGFVESTRGKAGGYRLARDPSAIHLAEVVGALEPGWGNAPESQSDPYPEVPLLHHLEGRIRAEFAAATVADALMWWQRGRRALTYSI